MAIPHCCKYVCQIATFQNDETELIPTSGRSRVMMSVWVKLSLKCRPVSVVVNFDGEAHTQWASTIS